MGGKNGDRDITKKSLAFFGGIKKKHKQTGNFWGGLSLLFPL
jgi:hypothetical protein